MNKDIKKILVEQISGFLFCFSQTEINNLKAAFDEFGIGEDFESIADIEAINKQTEAKKEDKKYCLKIKATDVQKKAQEIKEYIDQLGDDIGDIRDWYHDVNSLVKEVLGEGDGSLFIAAFAITSMQNAVQSNTLETFYLFRLLKKDYKENWKLLDEFINYVLSAKKMKDLEYDNIPDEFKKLNITYFMAGKKYFSAMSVVTKLKNFLKVAAIFIEDENLNFKKTVDYLLKSVNITKGMKLSGDGFGQYKVFSFVMNLLDPDYKLQTKYDFVTIDTHMVNYLAPPTIKDKKAFAAKVFTNTNNLYNEHVNYVKKIQDRLKTKYNINLLPNQLQAIAWYIAISQYRRRRGVSFIETLKMINYRTNKEYTNLKDAFVNILDKITDEELGKLSRTRDWHNVDYRQPKLF